MWLQLSSGPVVLMAPDGGSTGGAAVAIGPLSNFKLATSTISTRNSSSGAAAQRVWEMG